MSARKSRWTLSSPSATARSNSETWGEGVWPLGCMGSLLHSRGLIDPGQHALPLHQLLTYGVGVEVLAAFVAMKLAHVFEADGHVAVRVAAQDARQRG